MFITATNKAASTREERIYRNSSKKCTRGEVRYHLIEELAKAKLGLREVEEFIKSDGVKSRRVAGNNELNSRIRRQKEEREIVGLLMRRKKRELSDICIELRKKKVKARRDMEEKLGGKTRVYWRVLREVRQQNTILRGRLSKKNEKKISFLRGKYAKRVELRDSMTDKEWQMYGDAEIFKEECNMRGESLRDPEIVSGNEEIITLDEGE